MPQARISPVGVHIAESGPRPYRSPNLTFSTPPGRPVLPFSSWAFRSPSSSTQYSVTSTHQSPLSNLLFLFSTHLLTPHIPPRRILSSKSLSAFYSELGVVAVYLTGFFKFLQRPLIPRSLDRLLRTPTVTKAAQLLRKNCDPARRQSVLPLRQPFFEPYVCDGPLRFYLSYSR